ncbi:MIP/aquaporin family protein [Segniliparus rugosus]|uniref:MIP family channel protein n=1 Tax=Segniliparus rugosus (strain ATCC BAA-974 / DSM 45345 / CCUG 50838 / CIP 108380 / JCM 13579 / CDC 945) TaxID=679197 RepID=E5XV25_SEGRC|nr:MIP/aquaporin family protein [Segniliparus rugosus]EFV11861.1 MIP family channel protein [Segniliparus rugosus ATCC BAA-974]
MLDAYLAEFFGTAVLMSLGCGVGANFSLPKSKAIGSGGSWLAVTFGWGLAVYCGAYVAFKSGAMLNPALTLGTIARGTKTFTEGVPVTPLHICGYLVAEFLGAFVGSVVAWIAYKQHYDRETDPQTILATFSTTPAIRSALWNTATEIIATFTMAFVIFHFAGTPARLGPLPVAFLIIGIGLALGGPTGYSLNPARDFSARVAHSILPIPGKGSSDWRYAPIGVIGPIIGAVLAGFACRWLPYLDTTSVTPTP